MSMAAQPAPPVASDKWFANFASSTALWVGSPYVFLIAVGTIVGWVITGPIFHFSTTWQLVINSWTNIVTFIVVFIIQNSQNRDSKAINLKLDELIRSVDKAHDEMIDIEKLSDKELGDLARRYERVKQEWEERRTGRDRRHRIA